MSPVAFYKAMADDTRLKTVLLVQLHGELCVCELTSALSLSQPKISRHLAQLRKEGVLYSRRDSQWVYYRISDDLPAWAKGVLELTLAENQAWLAPHIDALDCMPDRPLQRVVSN